MTRHDTGPQNRLHHGDKRRHDHHRRDTISLILIAARVSSRLPRYSDLNLRLTHAAGHLIQIDDDDVPADILGKFERVRDPLIQTPMVSRGEMLPRDLEPSAACAAAQGVVDLLVAEMGNS